MKPGPRENNNSGVPEAQREPGPRQPGEYISMGPIEHDDEARRALGERQLAETMRLVTQYGHSWGVASHLAAMSRAIAEESIRTPLILVTGV